MKKYYKIPLVLFTASLVGFGYLAADHKPLSTIFYGRSGNVTVVESGDIIGPVTLTCDSTCSISELAEIDLIENALNKTLTSACLTKYFMTPGRRLDNTNGFTPF